MKKIAKLLTLLLVVATVATGIVFAVSAADDSGSEPKYVSQNTSAIVSEGLVFAGTISKNSADWQLAYNAYSNKAGDMSLVNGENAVWLSFDVLYDADTNLKFTVKIRNAGSTNKNENILAFSGTKVSAARDNSSGTPTTTALYDFAEEDAAYGWYHFDMSVKQFHAVDPETKAVTYSYEAALYMNGTLLKEYPYAPVNETYYRFYDVEVDAETGEETATLRTTGEKGVRFYVMGTGLQKNTSPSANKNFNWVKGHEGGVGVKTPASSFVNLTYDLGEGGEMPIWTYDTANFKLSDFPTPPNYDFNGQNNNVTYDPYDYVYEIHKDVYAYANVGGSTVLPIPTKPGSAFAGWSVEGNPATATVSETDGVWTLNVAAEHTGAIELVAGWEQATIGQIVYEAEGATLGGEYSTTFPLAAPSTITLPTEVTLEGCNFLGWYTDPSFSGDPITSYTTTADDIADGFVTFYARFVTYIELGFDEDKTVTASGTGDFGRNIEVVRGSSSGATFEARDGLLYVTKEGTGSSTNHQARLQPRFAAPTSDAITFSFDVMKNGEEAIVQTDFRLRTSANKGDNVFVTIMSDGTIKAGSASAGTAIGTLTNELQTITVVVHFESDTTCVYEVYINGSPKYESGSTALKNVTKSTMEMLFCYFTSSSTGSIVLDDICIYDGEVLKGTYYNATFVANGEQVSVKKTANDIALPSSYAYWIGEDGKIYAAGDAVTLTENSTFTALTLDLLTGARVRMNAPSGLRFETEVNEAMLDLLKLNAGMTFKVGTLIVPTDKLSGAFTKADLAAAGTVYAELTSGLNGVEAEDGVYTFYASLINILPENYTRKFSAISYIEVKIGDDTYLVYDQYVEADNARSVYDVAYRLLTETEPTDTTVLESFVDKVVVLDASLAVCNTVADKYESPYTATYADGTLTVSRVDGEAITAENLTTVVIDGVSYTGGWQLVDGNLVAPYTLAE